MSVQPRILSSIPGRIRFHLPHWSGAGQRRLEQSVRGLPGVRRVEANSLTRNILIGFDPCATNEDALLSAVSTADRDTDGLPEDKPLPHVIDEGGRGNLHRARIAVRGLDRDPRVARKVLERLRNLIGVRVRASQLTGRILVEYDANQVDLHELLSRVADVELPDLPGEDRPAHPLDAGPLLHAATRTLGAALGLGLIVARRLMGLTGSSGQVKTAATAAGIIGLLRSFSSIRNGLRQVFGVHAADLIFSSASAVTLAVAGSPLGLTVTGVEGLLLLTEVMARRSSWRRYEDSLHGTAATEPGAIIRLEAEERLPLPAEVIEGTGTAIGRDGLPRRIAPGAKVSAGAELSGGPFVLQLLGGQPFLPQPRPAPPRPGLYGRYARILGPLSLGYAGLTALLTRSVGRTFEALLLVNPRTAIIGMESANLDAAARVLRAGVTVVGTRPDRAVRLPDILLLDGPRVLTDGLEVTTILSLDESLDESQVLALVASMSTAAGSPWGDAFSTRGNAPARGGSFNGLWITASIEGVRYHLGPPEDPPAIGEAVERRAEGGYLLMLAREEDGRPLGLVALRPRPSRSREGAESGARGSGMEITAVLPLDESVDASQVLALAGDVSTAAGSPWGDAFPPDRRDAGLTDEAANEGIFNGLWAAASIQGERYTLGPPEDAPAIGEAVERRHEGGYLLLLSREEDWRPLGFVTLRPRMHPSAENLVQTCRRLGVRLEMLTAGAPVAAQAVARRAGVALVNSADAVAVMTAHQQVRRIVAFVSDSAQAAPGLDLERQRWRYAGAKDAAIRYRLGESPARYYQRLNALLDRRGPGARRPAGQPSAPPA